MKKIIIGVMGPGDEARPEDIARARTLGALIAKKGWVLLSGGRNSGVMHAVNEGASNAGGLTVGVLPYKDPEGISSFVDIPIISDMGSGRNNINVLMNIPITKSDFMSNENGHFYASKFRTESSISADF